jgi:predicted Zn-dependent peptidase
MRIAYQTNKDSVAHSIDSVLEEVHKIIAEDVSAAEVQEQVEAWRNRFVFRYTNDFYIVSRLMYNELDDRPYDFDRIELEQVQKVTVKDVRRVARKYLKPESFTVAVFGALDEEEKRRLDGKLTLTTLEKGTVFSGGYDAPQPVPEPVPAPGEGS